MKLKHFKILSLLALVAIFVTWTACQDDFSESDFLDQQATLAEQKASADHQRTLAEIQKQYELMLQLQDDAQAFETAMAELQNMLASALADSMTARQMDLLANTGLILTYSIEVQANGAPVEGIDVSVSGVAESASKGTETTGSDGIARFNDVLVGFNTINLSGTGYIDASVTVYLDYNQLIPYGAGGYTYFLQRTEYTVLPVYADGVLDNSATIKGKVEIETNLVNDGPEVAEGIEIVANFCDMFWGCIVPPADGFVIKYIFVNAGNFGTAVVDAGGNYSLTVPASQCCDGGAGGIELLIPTFQKDQILAVEEKNGKKGKGPEVDTIPVLFGPNANYDYDVPDVPGAIAEFPMPPSAAGEGFTFKFDLLPTSLGEWASTDWPQVNVVEQFEKEFNTKGDTTLVRYQAQLKTRGSGYSTSPDIAISGGKGTGAEMYASLRGFFTGIATSGGAGYDSLVTGTAWVYYEGVELKDYNWNDELDTLEFYVIDFDVKTTAVGKIPATLTLPENGDGIDSPFETNNNYRVIGWIVEYTGVDYPGVAPVKATSVVGVDCEVNELNMVDGGRGFTSVPTFTFSGGAKAATQATFEIWDFETKYYVDVDNSNVTAYTLLPSDIALDYDDIYVSSELDYGDPIGGLSNVSNVDDAVALLKLNSSGDIVWKVPAYTVMTKELTKKAPKVFVSKPTSYPAESSVYINDDGEIEFLYDISSGYGYQGPFDVTIVLPSISGLPGSGATIELTGGWYQPDGTFEWGHNYTVLSRGSGYLQNVNRYDQLGRTLPDPIYNVKPGDTYVENIHFGTGQRLEYDKK